MTARLHIRSREKDQGDAAAPLRILGISHDGLLLCGFGCGKHAVEAVVRLKLVKGEWKEVKTPYCGLC